MSTLSQAFLLASILAAGTLLAADPVDGLTAYRAGDYETAIPQLQSSVAKTPNDPVLRAALLSALVYEGRVEAAADAAAADERDFPQSPEVLAARGEFAFYMGDMGAAEKLFRSAVKIKDQTPRAAFGLYRLCRAASLYRTARLLCLQAHQIDPDDALITRAWLGYLVPERRKEIFDAFVKEHPWFYKHADRDRENHVEVAEELNGRKLFELDGEHTATTIPLLPLLYDAGHIRGVGVALRLNGGRPLKMLLDTGAHGIVIRQTAADKADLAHLGSTEAWGVGDAGTRKMFFAVADSCDIGPLKFKACSIAVTEGKARVAGDDDGLLGADVFAGYIVQIDFQKMKLHLTPQPEREPNPQGYDRVIAPEEKDFTPVFRFGHRLMVPTALNGKSVGLFLIDTGGGMSTVDSTFARLSTKIHTDNFMRVKGVSGNVKDVFEVDKALIQFARFQQRNFGLTSFNLNNSPEHEEVRMDGILGFPVLYLFRLTLDYRNGLVKFEYANK